METVATVGHSSRSIEEVIGPQQPKPHKLTSFAQVGSRRTRIWRATWALSRPE